MGQGTNRKACTVAPYRVKRLISRNEETTAPLTLSLLDSYIWWLACPYLTQELADVYKVLKTPALFAFRLFFSIALEIQ